MFPLVTSVIDSEVEVKVHAGPVYLAMSTDSEFCGLFTTRRAAVSHERHLSHVCKPQKHFTR